MHVLEKTGDTMIDHNDQRSILLIARPDEERERLIDALTNAANYAVMVTDSFEAALDVVMKDAVSAVIAENKLPNLSGIDLLSLVRRIHPRLPALVIDDGMHTNTAMAAFRMGAMDYVIKPLNVHLIMHQLARGIQAMDQEMARLRALSAEDTHAPDHYDQVLDPAARAVALTLTRDNFRAITQTLNGVRTQLKASFVGLVDHKGNIVAAAGDMEVYNLHMLKNALEVDQQYSNELASILHIDQFNSNYFEGDKNSIYIHIASRDSSTSLAVICPSEVKPGTAWYAVKQSASQLAQIIAEAQESKPIILFA